MPASWPGPMSPPSTGGQAEGVKVLTDKLKGELQDTMAMCGVHSLSEISGDMIFRG